MKLLLVALAVIAFVVVAQSTPNLHLGALTIRTIGAFIFFCWIAWLGGIVGFHRGADAERERQRLDR